MCINDYLSLFTRRVLYTENIFKSDYIWNYFRSVSKCSTSLFCNSLFYFKLVRQMSESNLNFSKQNPDFESLRAQNLTFVKGSDTFWYEDVDINNIESLNSFSIVLEDEKYCILPYKRMALVEVYVLNCQDYYIVRKGKDVEKTYLLDRLKTMINNYKIRGARFVNVLNITNENYFEWLDSFKITNLYDSLIKELARRGETIENTKNFKGVIMSNCNVESLKTLTCNENEHVLLVWTFSNVYFCDHDKFRSLPASFSVYSK